MGDCIHPTINTALVHNFLCTKRDQATQALRGQRPHAVDLPHADRKRRIHAVHLLKLQHRHLAHPVSRQRQDRIRVCVQLFLIFCRVHQRHHRYHHPLVSCSQITQELPAFLFLHLHVIGHGSRKVLVGILSSLPVRYIRLHTQKTCLSLTYCLICRNGDQINTDHHILIDVRKLGHHIVGNI